MTCVYKTCVTSRSCPTSDSFPSVSHIFFYFVESSCTISHTGDIKSIAFWLSLRAGLMDEGSALSFRPLILSTIKRHEAKCWCAHCEKNRVSIFLPEGLFEALVLINVYFLKYRTKNSLVETPLISVRLLIGGRN